MDDIEKLCKTMTTLLKKDGSVMNLARVCVAVFECPAIPNCCIPNAAAYIFAKELLETNPSKQESASTQADSVAPD